MSEMKNTFRNLASARRFAFDIGHSVIKVCYTSDVPRKEAEKESDDTPSNRLHCIHFEVGDLEKVCEYISEHVEINGHTVPYSSTGDTMQMVLTIEAKLGVKLKKIHDYDCLVKGTNFLLRNILDEVFVYDHHNNQCRYLFHTVFNSPHSALFPYILVNVGTGVSLLLVESDTNYRYLGGTHLGGGAFFGLASLLTGEHDIDELLRMAEEGDHRMVDALVQDIYGSAYNRDMLGLDPDVIAGSFGKCSKREFADHIKDTQEGKNALVRSLLLMISNAIGQIVCLFGQQVKTSRIFFNGYVVRNRPIIMRTISYALGFWSRGTKQAHFLRHEAYTAAIGAYSQGMHLLPEHADLHNEDVNRFSWKEHYSGCSDLGRFVPKQPLERGVLAEVLELDCMVLLQPFPLISSDYDYVPDTVNLNMDIPARKFWITCMEGSVEKMVQKAADSQKHMPDAKERAATVHKKYLDQLKLIRDKPFSYGTCNVRNLLDLREQIFIENNFEDLFLQQKAEENRVALKELKNVLIRLDKMDDVRERLYQASLGLLAGNVFDWGAKEVVKMLEKEGGLSFEKAVECIPARPWLVDMFDSFLEQTVDVGHKCAVIFADNSGADVLLGVLPFARELLKLGTKVILVANYGPALNDITHDELLAVMPEVVAQDDLLSVSYQKGQLKICHSGQASPCLDLRRVNSKLCELVVDEGVDLVVIEGMGRALHTNFTAKFSVNSLKAAVIKTEWLADRMGGQMFSIVFKFEKPEDSS